MQPLISFIIPYYNIQETLLKGCLDSIMALNLQSHEREIVIIDDGSELPAKELLKDYINSCHIFRQENKGLSEARNSGLKLAIGEYVQFVDADDRLIDYIYNKCIDSLIHNKPDILKFHYSHNPEPDDKPLTETIYESGAQFVSQNNLEAGACAYIFKRNILKSLRFSPGIFHEDEEFTPLLFLRAGKTVITDAQPYFYYQREDSIVSSYSESIVKKRLDDFYNVILRLKDLKQTINENLHLIDSENDRNLFIDDIKVDETSLKALTRKIDQASMDYIINVIRLNKILQKSNKENKTNKSLSQTLDKHLAKMKADGLFPLNKANYTRNYSIFRSLVNNSLLRKFLLIKDF